MQIESKIIGIINDKLKNPIYETLRLLNMKTILTKSNFSKKEGVAVHMVVLHFVYMLVMNKKISTLHTPEQFGQPADLHPDTLPELIRTASRFIFGQF